LAAIFKWEPNKKMATGILWPKYYFA